MVDQLLRGHDVLRKTYLKNERDFLVRLASEGQTPAALYIGCSDSRVVPELLTAAAPGELFVVRNVANIVPPLSNADASVGAALEYAAHHLEVAHLIVCGHVGCGGVLAAVEGLEKLHEEPSLKEWLSGVLPAVERARRRGLEGDALWRAAVEENVLAQLVNLITFPRVADALENGRVELHAWVYDLFALELNVYDRVSGLFVAAREMIAEETTP